MAGVAFLPLSAVGLAPTAGQGRCPKAVELHERAHLVQAFLPGLVSRLMARLPAPHADEYAATNRGEHFAEMAASAWQVATAPDLMTIGVPPVDRLDDAGARVPGTAAFVAWYLRHLRREDVDGYDDLARAAAARGARYRAEADALWTALEARQLPGGGFPPWGCTSVRECLHMWRTASLASDRWIDRAAGHLLTPSLLVVSVV
jgi:hypothetical protein